MGPPTGDNPAPHVGLTLICLALVEQVKRNRRVSEDLLVDIRFLELKLVMMLSRRTNA